MTEYIYGTDGDEGHWLTGEEIIRCPDCKYYHEREHGGWCAKTITKLDRRSGYCAWAKKRD